MATTIILPKLGITMTEGTITKWLKSVGDYVEKGEPLFEIESDKFVQEWECSDAGYLKKILVEAGDPTPVAAPVAILGEKDEVIEDAPAAKAEPEAKDAPEAARPAAPAAAAAAKEETKVVASPRARRYAGAHDVDISKVTGSGEKGRIREKDVIAFVEANAAAAPAKPAPQAEAPTGSDPEKILPYSGIRKITGERLHASYVEKPHIYITYEIVMDHVLESVAQMKAAGEKVSSSDYIIDAAAKMLRKNSDLNAFFTDKGIELQKHVSVGYAVDTSRGLLVPVIKDADEYNIKGISRLRREIVKKAIDGKLTGADMDGGTITVSNLGSMGVKSFTSIINPPQIAILSIGGIRQQLLIEGQSFRVANVMDVTIAVDHRAIDGMTAARALKYFKDVLEGKE